MAPEKREDILGEKAGMNLTNIYWEPPKFLCGLHLGAQMVNNLPAVEETLIQSLGQKDPLEMGIAPYSSIFAWRIPWIEDPGGLQSMGLQRVGHDWTTNTFTFLFLPELLYWEKTNDQSFQALLEMDLNRQKIIGLRTSFLSTNQNGSLCGSRDLDPIHLHGQLIGTPKPLSGFSPNSVYIILYKYA